MNRLINILSGAMTGCLGLLALSFIFATSFPVPEKVMAETTGVKPDFRVVTKEDFIFHVDEWYTEVTTDDIHCLVQNAYHEARSDGYAGMYAVTMVVMNRVLDPRYPDTICEVVYQGPVRESWKTRQNPDLKDSERKYYPIRHRCQFSWYCDGRSDDMRDEDAFYLAQEIAHLVARAYTGEFPLADITEGSTHYHTNYVTPKWRNDRGMAKITRIGVHYFYRWEIL